jgi:hypothetical protein
MPPSTLALTAFPLRTPPYPHAALLLSSRSTARLANSPSRSHPPRPSTATDRTLPLAWTQTRTPSPLVARMTWRPFPRADADPPALLHSGVLLPIRRLYGAAGLPAATVRMDSAPST